MNNDLISRSALKKAIEEEICNFELPISANEIMPIIDNIPTVDIQTAVMELYKRYQPRLATNVYEFGLELQEFSIISINIPQDDPSIVKLKEAKDLAARLKITGRDVYQMERSFDVLEGAANNQGSGGQMVGAGIGLGVGMGMGSQMGTMANNLINTNPMTPPPLPQQQTYFVYVNGQQVGGQTIPMIQQLIYQGVVTQDTLVWTPGMANWVSASQVPALAGLFITPPPITTPPIQ